MALSLHDLFRTLSSFSPPRASLRSAPWEDFVDWSISQGLAPLASYNLEFRLGGADAPEWARDRLLSIYSGSINDNVMKLVNFKRAVDELEGRRIILLGGASVAETVYPHIGFRPVLDVHLLVAPGDLDGFANFLGGSNFRPSKEIEDARGAARVLSDGNTQLLLYTSLGGAEKEQAAAVERAIPTRVYGPSFFRFDLEDAILSTCLDQARNGYDTPLLTFVDLRELLMGAPSMGGVYSRPVDAEKLKERAERWGASRALYASGSVVTRLFPELAEPVGRLLPSLSTPLRLLIDAAIVTPLSDVSRRNELKLAEKVRRILTGTDEA